MPNKMTDTQARLVAAFRLPAEGAKDAREFGSALRRALLDETPGMAATAVRIEGAQHEYQALPGVREDTLALIQNVKRIRVGAQQDRMTAVLDSGCPAVTAGELRPETGVVANPGLALAHLSPGARLRMEIVFERGKGYAPARTAPEGFIPLEASFCPVRRAAFTPREDCVELVVETDGTIAPDAALGLAMQAVGDVRHYEAIGAPQPAPAPKAEIGPEFHRDPFAGVPPPSTIELAKESYQDFLTYGIPRLLNMLFPLTGRPDDESGLPAGSKRRFTRGRRLDLIDYRLEMPQVTPEQCEASEHQEGLTYEARLVLRTRIRRSDDDRRIYPSDVAEEEIDMGTIPLMTDYGGFVIRGSRRSCVMPIEGYRVQRVGDLLLRELGDLIVRMKPILEERMNITGWAGSDIVKVLPLSATVNYLMTSSQWCQYSDETNPVASITHCCRTTSKAFTGGDVPEDAPMLKPGHFGRLNYLETPEGPNIGLVHTLCHYVRLGPDGELLTAYRKVEDGQVTDELAYLAAEEEPAFRIAGWDAVGPDGRITGDRVLVRTAGDIRRVPAGEVQLVSVSPVQPLSYSTSLIPFLGHDDPTRALMGTNMQRQAVMLVEPEQPLVKTGVEARAALDSGQMLTARRAGKVVEVAGDRIVVRAGSENDVYHLRKFRRTNQATCANQQAVVWPGDDVDGGQVLADAGGTSDGEIAIGRNILVAYMPFKGMNFEDAICISDELVRQDTLSSIHLEWEETDAGDSDVWIAPVGTRVKPGDVLVQESGGRRRTLLTAPPYNPRVVVDARRSGGKVRVLLVERQPIKVGDKLAGRHGNKGVVAKVLPASQMPHLEDGTPVQMVLDTLGVISRLNLGQILETHYGALAHALGTQFTIPPFMTPSHDLLRAKLKEAGLPETGMMTLYDGETGRAFESPVTVGYLYMLKLSHRADDKIHAISTGVPSLLTGQPAGLRRGGQRLGSLEIWALEAYNAGCTLQESLTVKSDDAEGREKAALALLAGEEVEPAGEGQSLQLLEAALRGAGINVEEDR